MESTLYCWPDDLEKKKAEGWTPTGKLSTAGCTHELKKIEYWEEPVYWSVITYEHLSIYYVQAVPLFSGTWAQCMKWARNNDAGEGICPLLLEPTNADYVNARDLE